MFRCVVCHAFAAKKAASAGADAESESDDESESDSDPSDYEEYRDKNIRRHKVGVVRTNAVFLNQFFLQQLVSSHDSVWCGMRRRRATFARFECSTVKICFASCPLALWLGRNSVE